jgi:predicted enzyme related to lactoylglutathione lyase
MGAIQAVIYTVSDLEKAKPLYATLLGTPHTDTPYYVGYNVAGQEFAVVPAASQGTPIGSVANIAVDDINAAIAKVVEAGGEVAQDPKDVGGGNLIAMVKDVDGTLIGLAQGAAK